jgi:hypothetical protein
MGTKRYSEEFKREALDAYKQLGSAKAAGELVGCSHFAILQWAKKAKAASVNVDDRTKDINPCLLKLANGNDLTAYIGRDITQMMPREIWDFLRLLNVKGDFKIEQTIHL